MSRVCEGIAGANLKSGRPKARTSRNDERPVASAIRRSVVPHLSTAPPERVLVVALVVVGAALRLWQYFANSSLWIDEAALARNIIERPLRDLFGSLHYAQVAPPGFLAIEKGVVKILGISEYALRLFPLISGILGLILFWGVARRILERWAAVFALALFALGIPFIYSTSQVKQYASDTSAALLLLLIAVDTHTRGITRARAFVLASAGAIVVWISHTAILILAGIAAALGVIYWKREAAQRRLVLICLFVWAFSLASAALHAISNVSDMDREYFQAFWRAGFMPFPPRRIRDLLWIPQQLVWVFGAFATGLGHIHGGLNYRWSPLFTAMLFYGLWSLSRVRRDAGLFVGLPILCVLGASAAGFYPFTARLQAFLIPFFLVCVAAGADRLLANLPRRFAFLNPVVLALLGGPPIYAIATALPPSRIQHLRPALEHLARHHRDGDVVYVYSGAALSFRYYAQRLKLSQNDVFYGRCSIPQPREYLKQLDQLRGNPRAWIVMTHEQHRGERELILEYLERLGRQLDVVDIQGNNNHPTERASIHLYDLSAPPSNVDAHTFPIPAALQSPAPGMLKWGCYGITGGEPTR